MPVPVIVSNFENFYNKEINRRKEEELKKAEEARQKDDQNKEGTNNTKHHIELDSMDGKTPRSPRGVLVCGMRNGEENSFDKTHTTV